MRFELRDLRLQLVELGAVSLLQFFSGLLERFLITSLFLLGRLLSLSNLSPGPLFLSHFLLDSLLFFFLLLDFCL